VVRGGWTFSGDQAPMPGMTVDAVARMRRRDVSVYAGNIDDAHPPVDPQVAIPPHPLQRATPAARCHRSAGPPQAIF
jgi:hypothetical protein